MVRSLRPKKRRRRRGRGRVTPGKKGGVECFSNAVNTYGDGYQFLSAYFSTATCSNNRFFSFVIGVDRLEEDTAEDRYVVGVELDIGRGWPDRFDSIG